MVNMESLTRLNTKLGCFNFMGFMFLAQITYDFPASKTKYLMLLTVMHYLCFLIKQLLSYN